MTFEEKLNRLNEIVTKLESPDALALDTALSLFEEGIGLVRACRQRLDTAEVQIQNINDTQENGSETENGVFDGFRED